MQPKFARQILLGLIDGNGKVERKELRSAVRRLQRLDLNDDEILEFKELLTATDAAVGSSKLVAAGESSSAAVALHVNFGERPTTSLLNEEAKPSLTMSGSRFVLQDRGVTFLVSGKLHRDLPGLTTVADFLVAQLEDASPGENGLRRSAAVNQDSLRGILELFPFADQDGDEVLTVNELRAYLALLAEGQQAQYCVKLRDCGLNLFPYLDIDGDLRLTPSELAQIRDLPLSHDGQLPKFLVLEFGTLPATDWGGVLIPAIARRKPQSTSKPNQPAWFAAQDRNGDGVVSRREFVGPSERFRQVDANGDELLDLAEAISDSARP